MVCSSLLTPSNEFIFLLICSALGILGSLIIITLQIKYSSLRGYFNTLILYISFSDLFRSFSILIPCSSLPYPALQSVVGIVIESSFIVSVFLSMCIILTLYSVIILSSYDIEKYHKKWIFISLVIIPGCMSLPLITHSYTTSDRICDLSSNSTGTLWRYSLIDTPSILCILISCFSCLKIHWTLHRVNISKQKRVIIKKIILFPIITCIDVLPTVFFHIFPNFNNNCSINQFNLITLGIFALHGLFNSMLFAVGNTFKGTQNDSLFKSIISYNSSSFFSRNLLEDSYFPQKHELSNN